MPLVPVANGTRLVAPTRLYARLRDDLAPFAYEAPPPFAQDHAAVLAELGMRQKPTPADLMGFLLVRGGAWVLRLRVWRSRRDDCWMPTSTLASLWLPAGGQEPMT